MQFLNQPSHHNIKDPSNNWNIKTNNQLPYFTCTLLDNWTHGFFTAQYHPLTPQEISHQINPSATPYRLKQIHGDIILSPLEISQTPISDPDTQYPNGDALISDRPNQSLWVATADCNPILIADTHTGQVAAIHAGWRGTAQKILTKTINRFQSSGSQLSDIRIAIGPAISGEVYQVTTQTALQILQSLEPNPNLDKYHHTKDSPILPDPQQGRVRIDIRTVNYLQLLQIGITPPQIAIAPHCTFLQPEYFFSYRRDQQKKVQWSGIIS